MSALGSKFGKTYIIISTLISSLAIFIIVLFLLLNSRKAVAVKGWELFTIEWYPPDGKYGILPMLYGSISVTLISLLFAVPVGISSAIVTSEILPSRHRVYIKSLLEILAGIPSVIYGLIGVAFLSVWVRHLFSLQSGRTIFTAGILLGIMVLPTIISLSDDALYNVPRSYREAAIGLGLYNYEIFLKAVMPIAKGDIIGAVLLALGRALGETMAVMLVIGSIDKIPNSFINFLAPGQTITSKLGREITEAAFGSLDFSVLIFMGLLLLAVVLLLTWTAMSCFNTDHRLYE